MGVLECQLSFRPFEGLGGDTRDSVISLKFRPFEGLVWRY